MTRRLAFALLVFISSAAAACHLDGPVTPPDVTIVVVGGDAGLCASACERLRAAHCPEGEPSPRTHTECADVCRRGPALFGANCIAHTDGGLEPLHACGVRCVE